MIEAAAIPLLHAIVRQAQPSIAWCRSRVPAL